VDDFDAWRRFVFTMVQQESNWQIVGEAADGLEAVQRAEELQPDLILLDIDLPKLNGIEAARQIRERVPNAKILFLTQHDSSDIAAEALSTGASGYILKSDAGNELPRAVEAVSRGNRFVSRKLRGQIPADRDELLTSSWASALPRETEITPRHEVQFYSNDAVFLESVTQFIGAALNAGNAAIVFATGTHRDNLLQELLAQGVDVDGLIQQGAYVSLDAADTLSIFMVNDWPDTVRFFEGFTKLIESASKAAKAEHPRVAIFGEGVALLWAKGKRDAAIRLEQLGNDLAKTHDVHILCAYPFSSFHVEEDKQAFKRICVEHSAVYWR
jgi:DNA-binding NarL/FixJ family response regulator